MRIQKIPHDKNGHYTIFEATDIEFADPVKYYAELLVNTNVALERDLLLSKKPPFPMEMIDNFLLKRAIKEWDKKFKEYMQTEVPSNFLSLLKCDSKNEQIKLLKGQSLTPEQLIAFILRAWTDFGFTFSQYSAEHHHNGLDTADLPKVVEVKGDTVEKVGDTPLSDGQLKHAMKYRHVVVSKFLDKQDSWHCLFVTFKSLRGEEPWKDGQPHYHYISDKFGIKRENVVTELKNKNYNLGTLPHIDIVGYRDKK